MINQRLAKILTISILISAFFPISSIVTVTQADVKEQELIAPTTAIALPFLNPDTDLPEVSKGQRLAMFTKPAVVRVLDGYRAKIYWPSNGKTYTVTCGASGSGFFISSNGYIVTNAHATSRTHQGEEKGKDCIFEQFVKQVDKDRKFTETRNGQEYDVTWQSLLASPSWIEYIKKRTVLYKSHREV